MITATFGQALSGAGSAVDFIHILILWRFIVSTSTFLFGLS